MRIKAIVEYKGTNYQGWQRQVDYPSIQETIENVLSQYLGSEITIYASGRTDAGVHALGQVFHFDTDKEDIDMGKFKYSVNRMLPDDINIISMEIVDSSFNSRFEAKVKTYLYKVAFKQKLPIEGDLYYCCPFPTDVDKVIFALDLFKGEHNFKNFTSKEEDDDNFVRSITSIETEVTSDDLGNKFLSIRLSGDGFMRYMVRDIVGTAIAYGQNQIDLAFIKDRLDSNKERNVVKFKAPASGLYLEKVLY